MGDYIDANDYVTHNFITSACLVKGEHTIQGVNSIEVSRAEAKVTTKVVADGTAVFIKKPSKAGMIKVGVLDSSKSHDVLESLFESGEQFSFSFKDSNAPDLNCGGQYSLMENIPDIKRADNDVDVREWVFLFTYLKMRGGSYKLISE